MTTIDFTRIRSTPKSRNDSFEALAVQLFHKTCPAPANSTFVSLRGDGGDGGVEAYFRTPAGTILGVQAKYFFQLGSSELGQIDHSLRTALTNHPTLSEYWIYIPFDLTGRVAAGRRGTSQAEKFEKWKRKIEAEVEVEADGSALQITLCPAAVIRGQLMNLDSHGGIRRYWFEESTLSSSQIQHCLDQAIAFAGPRYTSSIDIVTNAHDGLDFFGGIGDIDAWDERILKPIVSELRSQKNWSSDTFRIVGEQDTSTICTLIEKTIAACENLANLNLNISLVAAINCTLCELVPLLAKARDAQEQDFYNSHGKEYDTPGFRQFHAEYMCAFPAGKMDATRKWEELALKLQAALASQIVGAATTRSLLLVGPAGIGKTHAIVSAALRRLKKGGQSLIVFGDDFRGAEPWEVIRSKLGFGGSISRPALFESLETFAEHTGFSFVIYIDALNESPRHARWKDKLPELLSQCKPYDNIKVCVSTRDTYRNLIVDSKFPGFAFEHIGFSGQEYNAIQAFASHYGLDTEITPLFSPELSNPLFLHLACKTLQEEGRNSLDMSLPGFVALLESHLKHSDKLVRDRLQYSNPRNLVRAAMLCLANVLTHNLPQHRTWDTCIAALEHIIGSELTAESLLNELEHEGLIILSSDNQDTWTVRLGYQRYGDILRATSLVESIIQPSGTNADELAKKIAALTKDDEGLLEALAAVLPEKTDLEITSIELGMDSTTAHRLFLNALPWRSRASVTYMVDDHMYAALYTPGLWAQFYETLFRLSIVPAHHLNAINWLGPFLRSSSLTHRDTYLSFAALKSFEDKGAVWSLINATLKAEIVQWPAESRRLATVTLAWLSSCADRRIRDLSAKGLARIIASQPELGGQLTEDFEFCDDDYILESISLSIYSACLLAPKRKKEFVPVLERLLTKTFNIENILVRDSVRLLGHRLKGQGLSKELTGRLDNFPKKTVPPKSWPTLEDAKPLLTLDDLPSNMELWGHRVGPDFWRYQVESKICDFDLKNAGISHENIACWLMTETLKLGYPGNENCALQADRALTGRFGSGRSRQGSAERLGKKYYWIALHRLIGVLADNVKFRKDSFSDWKPSPTHLWSVGVRKVDLTDVRDISPPLEYPDELLEGPRYIFPDHTSDIKQWVRSDDFTPHESCLVRFSTNGTEWVALSLYANDNDDPLGRASWEKPHLNISLHYDSVFVPESINTNTISASVRDAFESQGASCYRGYIAEYPNSPIFDQAAAQGYFNKGQREILFSTVQLSRGNEWEYDFSYSTPERQDHLQVPCQDIVNLLELQWDRQRGWIDSSGELIAFETRVQRRHGIFIRRSSLNKYLMTSKRKVIYQRFAFRGFSSSNRADNSQIDMFSWLLYQLEDGPRLIKQHERPFNC